LTTAEANNAVLLDTAIGNAVLLAPQGVLQVVAANTPQSVAVTAALATLYTVSIYIDTYGDGAPGSDLITTITWTDPSGAARSIVLDPAGNTSTVQMEQYPLFCQAGSTITVALTFSTTTFHYDASVRIVAMPL
jgi:hypothetical protein